MNKASHARDLQKITAMMSKILSDVERTPITIVTPAEPRH